MHVIAVVALVINCSALVILRVRRGRSFVSMRPKYYSLEIAVFLVGSYLDVDIRFVAYERFFRDAEIGLALIAILWHAGTVRLGIGKRRYRRAILAYILLWF